MCVNSIGSASEGTPDAFLQVVIAPRGLSYPDTEEPVVQLRLLRGQHLEQDALEEIAHLAVVDPALVPLEGRSPT